MAKDQLNQTTIDLKTVVFRISTYSLPLTREHIGHQGPAELPGYR
jgi:hypothetical protein